MTYGRQQLLWQKQVTVVGFIDLNSQMDECQTGVVQFQHVDCHRRSVRRQRFAPMSLFFVAADAYSRSFCEFLPARRYASAGLCDSVCLSVTRRYCA